jgi:hypothetical protein
MLVHQHRSAHPELAVISFQILIHFEVEFTKSMALQSIIDILLEDPILFAIGISMIYATMLSQSHFC